MQRRLAEEYERCQHYLDPATRKPLIAAVEAQLLERHIGAILEKGALPCPRAEQMDSPSLRKRVLLRSAAPCLPARAAGKLGASLCYEADSFSSKDYVMV